MVTAEEADISINEIRIGGVPISIILKGGSGLVSAKG